MRKQRDIETFRWRPAFFLDTKNGQPISNLECNPQQRSAMQQTAALIFTQLNLMHAHARK
jgi:hypothetical protein